MNFYVYVFHKYICTYLLKIYTINLLKKFTNIQSNRQLINQSRFLFTYEKRSFIELVALGSSYFKLATLYINN